MAESPLSDRELTILRGMIDEYETRRIRRSIFGEWWRDGKVLAATFGGIVLGALEIAQLIATLHSGH